VTVNGSPDCIDSKQVILNCLTYGVYSSGGEAGYSCASCITGIPSNPQINSQYPSMYLYLTGALTTLSSGLNGVACQPTTQNITHCVGYFMYDANTYHCSLCAYAAATPA